MKKIRRIMALIFALILMLCMCPAALADSNDETPEYLIFYGESVGDEFKYEKADLEQDIDGSEQGFYWNAADKTLTINSNFNKGIAVKGDLELLVDGEVKIENSKTVNGGLIATQGDLSIYPVSDEKEDVLTLVLNETGSSPVIQVGDMNNPDSANRCVIHSGVKVSVTVSSRSNNADNVNLGKYTVNAVDCESGNMYIYGTLEVEAEAGINVTGINAANVYVMPDIVTGTPGHLGMDVSLSYTEGTEIMSDKIATGITGNVEIGSEAKAIIEVINHYNPANELNDIRLESNGVLGDISANGTATVLMSVTADSKAASVNLFDNLGVSEKANVIINEELYKVSMYRFTVELDDILDIELDAAQMEGWVYGGEITTKLKLKAGTDITKYALPDKIEFSVDGMNLEEYITYDSKTGEITIPALLVQGPITIKATAKELPSATPDNSTGGADNNTNNTNNSGITSPNTSDSGHPMMWVVLLAAGVAIFGGRKVVKGKC